MKNKKPTTGPQYVAVNIPTTSAFLKQWHDWVAYKVSKHFVRNKERIADTAQRARLRLLQKEFVDRWFFKHLTDDLVDHAQASYILGGVSVTFIGKLNPVFGKRSSPDSLWRIKDLLDYAKFDYDRYFYSAQGHTIDSVKVLRLLGYGKMGENGEWQVTPKDFSALESLYRQGRLKPAELTEHECSETMLSNRIGTGCSVEGCERTHYSRGYCGTHYHLAKKVRCQDCDKGRESLNQRGVSLVHRWSEPETMKAVEKLRWNDNQLIPFLRDWKKANRIKGHPHYIMRPPELATIEAGLKKYAYRIIQNDVINSFKSIGRTDDLSIATIDGLAPDLSTDEIVAWDGGDNDEAPILVVKDVKASEAALNSERGIDIKKIIIAANLSDDEAQVINQIDLLGSTASELAATTDNTISQINALRASALEKLKQAASGMGIYSSLT